MATLVINIEGVLTENSPETNLLSYESSGSGRVLYSLMRDSGRIILLSLDHSKNRVQAWLARERFSRYADVHCYPPDSMLSPAEWRVQHLKDLIGIGHHISFYIDSDPKAVGMALEAGVDALLLATTGVVPGSDRDKRYSPWYDLVDTIEQQSMLRATRGLEDDPDA